ncbi:MAG: hypothetical protein RBR64_08170 [Bacteroidales bacterium]|jgi:hypothetical protein|nr:hypothetical protein [Bacteroidales bacterium]
MFNLDIEFINKTLNDIWSFHLVLLGIALTIFTLLYSFILSKRDTLIDIAENVNQTGTNPEIKRKEKNAINYIQNLRKVNDKIVYIVIATFTLFVFGWVAERIIPDNCCWYKTKLFCFYSLSILTVLVLIFLIVMSIKIYYHYKKTTRII